MEIINSLFLKAFSCINSHTICIHGEYKKLIINWYYHWLVIFWKNRICSRIICYLLFTFTRILILSNKLSSTDMRFVLKNNELYACDSTELTKMRQTVAHSLVEETLSLTFFLKKIIIQFMNIMRCIIIYYCYKIYYFDGTDQ